MFCLDQACFAALHVAFKTSFVSSQLGFALFMRRDIVILQEYENLWDAKSVLKKWHQKEQ